MNQVLHTRDGDEVEVCIEVPSSWLAPAKCKIASDRIGLSRLDDVK